MLLVGCQETPPAQVPSDAVTTEIGPQGGTARSEDGTLTIEIPAGAVAEPILVSIARSSDAPVSIGPAFRVQPNIGLLESATVTWRYAAADVQGRDIPTLGIAVDVGGRWEPLVRTDYDEGAGTVEALDDELSFHYGLLEGIEDEGTATGTGTDSGTGDSTGPSESSSGSTTDAPTTSTSSGSSDSGSSDSGSSGSGSSGGRGSSSGCRSGGSSGRSDSERRSR
ncbi:MAG: hypothetical protein KDK70_17675 [Myxococcales bacterium]|nr:hypothetical protein [Myxococcales bacterium]